MLQTYHIIGTYNVPHLNSPKRLPNAKILCPKIGTSSKSCRCRPPINVNTTPYTGTAIIIPPKIFQTPQVDVANRNKCTAIPIAVAATMAVKLALAEQCKYEEKIKARNEDIFTHSKKTGNITVLLAGRPYHTDPLVQHKLSNLISAMGINVISEDIARNDNNLSTNESFLVEQWAYINRILKAAQWVANQASDVHFMKSLSFSPALLPSAISFPAIAILSPVVLGSPFSPKGKTKIAAPYFLASAKTFSFTPALSLTELINARPAKALSPASKTSGSTLSIEKGTLTNMKRRHSKGLISVP